jgi:hypothetical protein
MEYLYERLAGTANVVQIGTSIYNISGTVY